MPAEGRPRARVFKLPGLRDLAHARQQMKTRASAILYLQRLAKTVPDLVSWTDRANRDMVTRNISISQVRIALETGECIAGPDETIKDNWEMVIHGKSSGDPIDLALSICAEHDSMIIVITSVSN